ncbi:MGA_1079 family surface serine endopeptidase [Mycoplasma procyoni]|uniref:MGA_1079 family surface serine endopeptidase n=1 Tax=Mycoplasma procyoni TaxID=568784 RepID=UPI00197C4D5C|nr:hypothetical protein [Mycoplasma procyoni]MBN3534915.1 hypothetical protein [Mycoplasma procyoni]
MKKKIIKQLSPVLFASATAFLAASCTINKNTNTNTEKQYTMSDEQKQNYQSVQQFFDSKKETYFSALEKNVLNTYKKQEIKASFNNDLFSFVNSYEKILKTDIAKPYSGVVLPANELKDNLINKNLKKFDDLVRGETFSVDAFDSKLVEEIQQTEKTIENRNKLINDKNRELDNFIASLSELELKNPNILVVANRDVINLWQANGIFSVVETDKALSELNNLITLYETKQNAEVSKVVSKAHQFLDNYTNYKTISSLKQKIDELNKEFNSVLETQDLVSDYLKNKINIFKEELKKDKELTEEQINSILAKVESVSSELQLQNLQNEVDNIKSDFENLKKELVAEIEGLAIVSKFKDRLVFKTMSFEDLTKFNEFKQSFSELKNSLISLIKLDKKLDKKREDKELKAAAEYDLYKKRTSFAPIYKAFELAEVDLINLAQTKAKLEEYKAELQKVLELNSQNIDNQKTVVDLFKEDTEKLWNVDFSENAQAYEIDKTSYSASYNFKNAKLVFDTHDTDLVDFEIVDLQLLPEDRNTLKIVTKTTLKNNPEIFYTIEKTKTFTKDVSEYLKNLSFNNLDQVFVVDYEALSENKISEFLALPLDKKLEFFKAKNRVLNNFFTFRLNDDFEIKNKRVYATFDVLFNKQVISSSKIPAIKQINFLSEDADKEKFMDRINENKVLEIINGPASLFFSHLKFKPDAPESHIEYLPSDAIEVINKLYDLPKFGKYEIFIKEIKDKEDYNGWADLVLWYKKDGKEAEIKDLNDLRNKAKRMHSFKLLNFDDVKPKNGEKFSAEDFVGTEAINSKWSNILDHINESNIALRKVMADGDPNVKVLRVHDVNDIIEQKAYLKMNYLFDVINGVENGRTDTNYDNETFVPLDAKTYSKNVERYTLPDGDLREFKSNVFLYYYDVKKVGKRGISFKLGIMNKRNLNQRYTSGKEITLINLVNDYKQIHYPNVLVNKLSLSNLTINKTELAKHTADYFVSHLDELNRLITININGSNPNLEYKHFEIPKTDFKISSIKRISGSQAYVRYSVRNSENQEIFADKWIKIEGFAKSETINPNQTLDFRNQELITVQNSQTEIIRERVIEPFWKDLFWKLDKETNVASWTLDKKYLQKTLLQPNARNRSLKLNILANMLKNDADKSNRIRHFDKAISLVVNFEDLLLTKEQVFKKTIEDGDINFNYFIKLAWNEQKGLEFEISMEDDSYKIVVDEPEVMTYTEGQTFDKNKAFMVLPAAVKTVISYTNDVEEEDFGLKNPTNRFQYDEMQYNEFGQPLLFSSDLDYLRDKTQYNPNQNVVYKLHDGYKMNVEQLRTKLHRGWEVVDTALLRNALLDGGRYFGTITFLGKVNDDPNDATFYISTNRHAENSWGVTDASDYKGEKFLSSVYGKKYAFAPSMVENNVDRTYSLRTHYVHTLHNTEIKLMWSGVDQISNDGKDRVKNRDWTVVVADLNKALEKYRADGNMQVVWKLENLMKRPNVKFDQPYWVGQIDVPNTREASTVGWPFTQYAGNINRRPRSSSHLDIVKGAQHNLSSPFIGGGASGSGVFVDGDSYYGIWTSGVGKVWANDFRYDIRNFNYFGVNWNGENPLELKNTESTAAHIIKANLLHPGKYDLPWFWKEIK